MNYWKLYENILIIKNCWSSLVKYNNKEMKLINNLCVGNSFTKVNVLRKKVGVAPINCNWFIEIHSTWIYNYNCKNCGLNWHSN